MHRQYGQTLSKVDKKPNKYVWLHLEYININMYD